MFQKGDKIESFIGHNTHFRGEITTKGTLRIDGNFDGNVTTEWLVIGEKAYVKGNAAANSIIVGGTIEGNLLAKGVVEIKKGGQVRGDIVTSKLTVSDGGLVDGRISMQNDGAKLIEMVENAKAEFSDPYDEEADTTT